MLDSTESRAGRCFHCESGDSQLSKLCMYKVIDIEASIPSVSYSDSDSDAQRHCNYPRRRRKRWALKYSRSKKEYWHKSHSRFEISFFPNFCGPSSSSQFWGAQILSYGSLPSVLVRRGNGRNKVLQSAMSRNPRWAKIYFGRSCC